MKKFWSIIKNTILYFFIVSLLITIIYRFVPPPITFLMVQRVVEQKIDGDEIKLERDWVPIEDISTFMQRAVIASEDQHFISHWGFDLEAIEKAYNSNKKSKRVKGGSTITE